MVKLDNLFKYMLILLAWLLLSDTREKTVLPELFAAELAREERTELATVVINSIQRESSFGEV
jgi:hypothetical protein